MNKKLYVVTAFGPMIDTICEVFETKDEALHAVQSLWEEWEKTFNIEIIKETIVEGSCWKTDDAKHQNIEWQIHTREI